MVVFAYLFSGQLRTLNIPSFSFICVYPNGRIAILLLVRDVMTVLKMHLKLLLKALVVLIEI